MPEETRKVTVIHGLYKWKDEKLREQGFTFDSDGQDILQDLKPKTVDLTGQRIDTTSYPSCQELQILFL
jgi:hypothetical protein